jgi:quinol-cytochrome oxidoreductase complex cytochrome b subunit
LTVSSIPPIRPNSSPARIASLKIGGWRISHRIQAPFTLLFKRPIPPIRRNIPSALYNNHPTFHISYYGMNYSNVLGYLLLQVFIFQFISGIFSSRYYTPLNTIAHDTVFHIMIDVNFGRPVRWYHVPGSPLYMLFSLPHRSRGIRSKARVNVRCQLSFSRPPFAPLHSALFPLNSNDYVWISGFISLGIPIVEGFPGYIPNRGQMPYRGVTVMTNIPVTLFNVYMSSSPSESIRRPCNVTTNRIFMPHSSSGFPIGGFIILHPYLPHTYSSSNPSFNSSPSIIPSFPLRHKDRFISMVIFSFTYNYSALPFIPNYSADILGNSDNPIYANPVATPNHTPPERHLSISHSRPRAFPNKTLGLVAVTLFLLLLL